MDKDTFGWGNSLFLVVNILLFLTFINTYADAKVPTFDVMRKKVLTLRRGVSYKTINGIKNGLTDCKVDTDLVLAIIKVESDFVVDAVNARSDDFGLMQINRWHIRKSKLDKKRLLSEASYNVRHGCKILKWFVKTYPLEEAVGRYNCGTRKSCINWGSVIKYKEKVLRYRRRILNVK